ncbi:response regulator [Candidatus Saganbacteria bacterium]|nr:response regulator [Candidatus Saganbacteria bacterium]
MAKKILVVDDESLLVEMIKMRLEANSYEVECAFDGEEAYAKAIGGKPDLIILDLMLPKMDGFEVCRKIKSDEAFKKIPIIMLSARAQDSDKQKGKEVGGDGYIVKPFESQELLDKIKGFLGK